MQNPGIKVGDVTFLEDGGDPVGAVHDISPNNRPEFMIYVENAGDFVVLFAAVRSVHFGKVILNVHRLSRSLQAALGHVHDAETPQ